MKLEKIPVFRIGPSSWHKRAHVNSASFTALNDIMKRMLVHIQFDFGLWVLLGLLVFCILPEIYALMFMSKLLLELSICQSKRSVEANRHATNQKLVLLGGNRRYLALPAPGNGGASNGTDTTSVRLFRTWVYEGTAEKNEKWGTSLSGQTSKLPPPHTPNGPWEPTGAHPASIWMG